MTINPITRTQIELAWWDQGRARDIALRFKNCTCEQVETIWKTAKAQGRLPSIKRPAGGFDWDKMLERAA